MIFQIACDLKKYQSSQRADDVGTNNCLNCSYNSKLFLN